MLTDYDIEVSRLRLAENLFAQEVAENRFAELVLIEVAAKRAIMHANAFAIEARSSLRRAAT